MHKVLLTTVLYDVAVHTLVMDFDSKVMAELAMKRIREGAGSFGEGISYEMLYLGGA